VVHGNGNEIVAQLHVVMVTVMVMMVLVVQGW